MWHKVKWLTFWVSMVLWFGNAWGCAGPGMEQNYKANQAEQPSLLEKQDSSDATTTLTTHYVSDDTAAPVAVIPENAPSLNGLDRTHWPKIKVSAELGSTRHYPIYFSDYPADRKERFVNFDEPVQVQLESALTGTTDHGLIDGHHALQLVSQPTKVALDVILLPYRMFVNAPWCETTTP